MRIGRVSPLQVFKFTHIWGHYQFNLSRLSISDVLFISNSNISFTEVSIALFRWEAPYPEFP